jgi:hypothetical protein
MEDVPAHATAENEPEGLAKQICKLRWNTVTAASTAKQLRVTVGAGERRG